MGKRRKHDSQEETGEDHDKATAAEENQTENLPPEEPQTKQEPSREDEKVPEYATPFAVCTQPETIEGFFQNGAARLGLAENGLLQLTRETVDEVIARVLSSNPNGALLFDRTEGFATLNLRGNLRLTEISDLFFSVTNLTDKNYRRHGSGFDSPGLNVSLSYLVRYR